MTAFHKPPITVPIGCLDTGKCDAAIVNAFGKVGTDLERNRATA
jgi:hypothetical protein